MAEFVEKKVFALVLATVHIFDGDKYGVICNFQGIFCLNSLLHGMVSIQNKKSH